MSGYGVLQVVLYFVVLTALAWPLGAYMARVYIGERTVLSGVLGPVERLLYRLSGVRTDDDMDWKRYAVAVLLFNLLGALVVYALQRLQGVLPLNPQDFGAVSADSSFNTAISFATNTNWQGYGGESTMSYLTQMLGLAVQNFLSAATGMATLAAFIRGFVRKQSNGVGNFWVDMTRSTLYVLLPLALVVALVLVSQGVVQNFSKAVDVPLMQSVEVVTPAKDGAPEKKETITTQSLPQGPAASQVAIKQLGTNGGGFFNVNSAHPYENPTPFSNFVEVISILLISAGLCFTFGRLVNDARQGWAIYGAMSAIFLVLTFAAVGAEETANPRVTALGVETSAGNLGGQGGALRRGDLRDLGHRNDVGVERVGQLDARLVHAARRPDPDVADAARRGGVRRRRLGPVRHAGVRDHRRVHRRTDGGPNAGVPGQEDPGVRDEDGVAGDPDPAVRGAGGHGAGRGDRARHIQHVEPRLCTVSRRCCTRSARPATTTAARSQASRPTRPSTTPHSAWRCGCRATGWSCRSWRSPAASPPRNSCRHRAERCRRIRRCSSGC